MLTTLFFFCSLVSSAPVADCFEAKLVSQRVLSAQLGVFAFVKRWNFTSTQRIQPANIHRVQPQAEKVANSQIATNTRTPPAPVAASLAHPDHSWRAFCGCLLFIFGLPWLNWYGNNQKYGKFCAFSRSFGNVGCLGSYQIMCSIESWWFPSTANMNRKVHSEHGNVDSVLLLMGNTGAGKSTIANLLRDPSTPELPASSSAKSVTEEWTLRPASVKGLILCDTPGLDNKAGKLESLANLTELPNQWKICFVLTPWNGRLSSRDVFNFRLVMDAFDINSGYSVIVNCVRKDDTSFQAEFIHILTERLALANLREPDQVMFLPRSPDLKQYTAELVEFIARSPVTRRKQTRPETKTKAGAISYTTPSSTVPNTTPSSTVPNTTSAASQSLIGWAASYVLPNAWNPWAND